MYTYSFNVNCRCGSAESVRLCDSHLVAKLSGTFNVLLISQLKLSRFLRAKDQVVVNGAPYLSVHTVE